MQAIILAAGESSRFWPLNQQHKSLTKLMGRSLIRYTIEGLKKTGIKDIIVVQGSKRDIEKELKDKKIRYIVQPEPKGTGDAVLRAKHLIKGPFLVLGAHKVDIKDYLPQLLNKFKTFPQKIVLTGVKTFQSQDYGILKFQKNKVKEIIENPVKGRQPSNIKATETYIFPEEFLGYLKRVSQREENLIDAINLFIKEKGAEAVLLKKDTASLKYPWHFLNIMELILKSSHISPKADIGKNTVISGPCYIGDNCQIGPHNVLRGPLVLGNNVKTGAFCEIKNSIVGDGSHFHSGYFGDSIFGENCRTGAGTITANKRLDRGEIKATVKGKKIGTCLTALGAIVGDNTKIGINVSLMPGVLIGSNCLVGPNSLVMHNIEDNKTTIL